LVRDALQSSQLLDPDFLASVSTQMRALYQDLATPAFAADYLSTPARASGGVHPATFAAAAAWNPFLSVLVRFFSLPPPHQLGPVQALRAAMVAEPARSVCTGPLLLPLLAAAMPDLLPSAILLLAPLLDTAASLDPVPV